MCIFIVEVADHGSVASEPGPGTHSVRGKKMKQVALDTGEFMTYVP